MHLSVGKRRTTKDVHCEALKKWSYDESTKVWSKHGAEPLQEDRLQGLELELAERWDGIVAQAKKQAVLNSQG